MPGIPQFRSLTKEEEEAETQKALSEFAAQMRPVKESKEAAKAGLDEALATITETLQHHWVTGSGRRLRQIVWSIWNGHTLVPMWDVLGGFDHQLGRAVAKLLEAKLLGALDSDEILRRVLKESGEFARFEDLERATPEDEEVVYPPSPVTAESLRKLADAIEKQEARMEAQARAEDARLARLEEANA